MKYCHPLASVADFSFRSRHFNSGLWPRTSVWLNGMSSFFVVVVIKCVPLLAFKMTILIFTHSFISQISGIFSIVSQWEQKLSRPDISLTSFWIPSRKANEDQAEQICLLRVSSGSFFSGLIFQFQQKLERVEGRASWHIDPVINGPERSLLALADVWAQPVPARLNYF